MREALWKRLGLDEDEWRDCRVSALEMTRATGTKVSASQVAVEYALARTFDEPVIAAPAWEHATARTRGRAPQRR